MKNYFITYKEPRKAFSDGCLVSELTRSEATETDLKMSYSMGGYTSVKVQLVTPEIFNSVKIEDINQKDYPDFTDAFISEASIGEWKLSESQLEKLNEDLCLVNELVFSSLH